MPIHSNIRKCIHIKLNGKQCGSPAVAEKARCFHHEEVVRRRRLRKLPFLRNAADLQLAVMDVIQALLERRLCSSDATALLYALQLAQNNLKTDGFRTGLATVGESNGSLIHHLLEAVDEVEAIEQNAELEAHAADTQEKQEWMKAGVTYEQYLAMRKKA